MTPTGPSRRWCSPLHSLLVTAQRENATNKPIIAGNIKTDENENVCKNNDIDENLLVVGNSKLCVVSEVPNYQEEDNDFASYYTRIFDYGESDTESGYKFRLVTRREKKKKQSIHISSKLVVEKTNSL